MTHPIPRLTLVVKRSMDLLGATLGLLLTLPLWPLIMLAIRLDSPGPVFFRQLRIGRSHATHTELFFMIKFRTMRADAEAATGPVWCGKGDSRITRSGDFLRKTRLDELPQFINVLKGDMSIVGPRPHAIVHNEQYRKLILGYMLRHKVKPGITGLAQVNGWRGETDTLEKMEKRIEFDLEYIRSWSLWLDLKIVFFTIFKGFINKNAY